MTKDGQFNPDARLVNNVGDFDDMANAVLYNTIASAINSSGPYSDRAIQYIQTWFLDSSTSMNPNLDYAQMKRGPDGQKGTHFGIL